MESNGSIAVVFNPPTAGRALQLKGLVVGTREPEAVDLGHAERHLEAFVAEAARVGVPPDNVRRVYVRADFIAVTVSIDEMFDQTPGHGAGSPL
jgi:hypothetical protein